MFYDLKPIQQMQKLQEILRPQDLDIIKQAEHDRFWSLIIALLEEKITKSKDLIYNAGRNEEDSKLKWNDRDLHFIEIEVLEELKKAPLRIRTLIENLWIADKKKNQI